MGPSSGIVPIAVALCLSCLVVSSYGTSLYSQFPSSYSPNIKWTPNGQGVDLILDQDLAAFIGSKDSWFCGGFGAWMKLPAGDSSGVVSTFYLSSENPNHCELDFEFLGNVSGQPYLLHTNIFVDGIGGREEQIYLWFDPTKEYHYYNFQWSSNLVVFYVDDTPIRMFRNLKGIVNVGFIDKPMGAYASIWDGSQWATEGGRIPIDWAAAPFTVSYESFRLNGCTANPSKPSTIAACAKSKVCAPVYFNGGRIRQIREVKANWLHYSYCNDRTRYPTPPPECAYNVL